MNVNGLTSHQDPSFSYILIIPLFPHPFFNCVHGTLYLRIWEVWVDVFVYDSCLAKRWG